MSTIDEKLKHFNELILKDAASERDALLQQIRAEMEENLNKKRLEFREQADKMLKQEISEAEREKNNIISKAALEGRQLLMKTREDIVNAVLDETRNKLREFVAGNGYYDFLAEQIKKSCEQAGDGELVIYLASSDLSRFSSQLEDLKKELPASPAFYGIDEDIIGGCRVFNRSKNIIVDNTLSERLNLCADKFFEVCKLRID